MIEATQGSILFFMFGGIFILLLSITGTSFDNRRLGWLITMLCFVVGIGFMFTGFGLSAQLYEQSVSQGEDRYNNFISLSCDEQRQMILMQNNTSQMFQYYVAECIGEINEQDKLGSCDYNGKPTIIETYNEDGQLIAIGGCGGGGTT
jgi:hypothetical protein